MNLDFSYLNDITGGDKEMMLEMLDLFIEDIPEQVNKIKELNKGKELSKLGAEAHKLKPTLLYVGLKEMHKAVQRLETLGKLGKYTDEVEELVQIISGHTKECIPLLKRRRKDFL